MKLISFLLSHMLKKLVELFEQWSGEKLTSSEELTQAGSNRRYFRLRSNNHVAVGCHGENVKENRTFIYLSQIFKNQNINTPAVLAVSSCEGYYLQEDLGSTSLFQLIENGRSTGVFSDVEKFALRAAISALPQLQFEGVKAVDFSKCYPQAELDRRTVMWDLSYFKYYFLKPQIQDVDELKLEVDFETFAGSICAEKNSCFLLRDFQSRNVMWHNDQPWFIDFQGGRKGMPHYDVASFLYQAKANFPDELRTKLLEAYLQAAAKYVSINAAGFAKRLPIFVLLRTLQVLGAYGFRGYFERKAHFLQSVPFAIENLKLLLLKSEVEELNIPYLRELLVQLTKKKYATAHKSGRLCVTVTSFSFLKGIPEDVSGNGGGFVFDCRGIVNPGRTEEYKFLTGLDEPVIKFIESNNQMADFLTNAYSLVDNAVERYTARGFSNLMVSFGCTGGQHRSVYSAQHLAEHLHAKFPSIEVELCHREQKISSNFSWNLSDY
jgi:aminoglycoside/choline kinase family phosphotransferase